MCGQNTILDLFHELFLLLHGDVALFQHILGHLRVLAYALLVALLLLVHR